jgi:hypothetical protein
VKPGLPHHSSKTVMSVCVNECLPGCGAQVSNPHAAMVSVTLVPLPSAGAPLAAAQQSSSKRVSESACSNIV